MGYCPFESRYNELYRDTGLGRLGWECSRGHDTAEHASDTALQYGQDGPRHGRPRAGACDSACARGLAGRGMSRYNKLYRDGKAAWPLRCVTIQSIVS